MLPKLGVLISGRGSNLKAIVNAIKSGKLKAEISVVISNIENASGLSFAQENDIARQFIPLSDYANRSDHDKALVNTLLPYHVDLIILAGYMLILGEAMLTTFKQRILNIHPSLLPSFKGVHPQKQALDYGVKISGCTVHYVTEELDGGPIIAQRSVKVHPFDTVQLLSHRILEQEHLLYPEAIQQVLNGG